MRIYVCPCTYKEKSMAVLPSVIAVLTGNGITPVMHEKLLDLYRDERVEYRPADIGDSMISGCDMLMTIGGDGMILKWAKRALSCVDMPVIGINTGRLGFMTAIDADELEKLSALADGTYSVSRRMLLTAEESGNSGRKNHIALNDIVLFKDVNSKLPEFTVRINGTTITKVRADGLIFSTPTGSTAYALSAGGPIIEPTVECIQMTALCAHTLLNRPMIFSGNDIVTVSYTAYEGSRVNMSVDGGEGMGLAPDDTLTIRKLGEYVKLAEIGSRSFYTTVSEKLMTSIK